MFKEFFLRLRSKVWYHVLCIQYKSYVSERTLTGFAEIEIDWNYVERLMPHEVIPPVPHHASYPTPSGWKPPNRKKIFSQKFFEFKQSVL